MLNFCFYELLLRSVHFVTLAELLFVSGEVENKIYTIFPVNQQESSIFMYLKISHYVQNTYFTSAR